MKKSLLTNILPILVVLAAGCSRSLYTAEDIPKTWLQEGVLFQSGPEGSFDGVAVKDPTIVEYGGKWHLFYTARSQSQYTLGYASAETLEGLAKAEHHQLAQLNEENTGYAAAPQVFYFEPQKTWYLVFQHRTGNLQPVYSTTKTIDDPASWTSPENLVDKDEKPKWIDFWVICDDRYAYLFYSRGRKDVFVRKTRLEDFPGGWDKGRLIFEPVPKPLCEAVHIYKVKGKDQYHLFFETKGDGRRYGMATAPALMGPWTKITQDYATRSMLHADDPDLIWTDEVSHGEMIRTVYNQKLEYDASKPRFLIQGMTRDQQTGGYTDRPWKLGIVTGY